MWQLVDSWCPKGIRSAWGRSVKCLGLIAGVSVRRLTPSPYCLFCHSSQFSSRSRAFGKRKETAATQAISATKMVKTYLFTSLLVHFRRIEPKKFFILSRIAMFLQEPSSCCSDQLISFGKHCWKEDLDDDYFEQKIGVKPHLRPLDLQGELISIGFI